MRGAIDETDLRIIRHLQADGRRPFAEIARDVHLSEGAVRQRVARLRRDGLLDIVGVVDPVALGLGVMATVGIRVHARSAQEVARRIAELPDVTQVALVTGSIDILAEVVCADGDHLLRVLSEDIARLPGVERAETFVFLRLVKRTTGAAADLLGSRSAR
jgi:Lrp/AsnC family transcriptional regulator for asnA, asnC and gidA